MPGLPTVTLEWNAVIEKEELRQGALSLDELVVMHRRSEIDLGIATTAASENTTAHEFPADAKMFRRRLEAVGWSDLSFVLTQSRMDLTYTGLSRILGSNSEDLPDELWRLIKPTSVPRNHRIYANQEGIDPSTPIGDPAYQKWRNKWCDVFSLEAHIAAGRDLFVSGDIKNFRGDRYESLINLGVGDICGFQDAPSRIRQMLER